MKSIMTNAESPQQTATLTIDQALQQAIAHHQAGQLQDAERLYRAILQAQLNHSDANHNLGVLAVQVKQPAAGLPHLKAALEANPKQGQYRLSYINALIQTCQTDAARQVLEQGWQQGLQGGAVEVVAAKLSGSQKINDEKSPTTSQPTSNGGEKQTKHSNPARTLDKAAQNKRKLPSHQEMNTLVDLFTQERYDEAEALACAITKRFPRHGLGWKVLGAVFMKKGWVAKALAPMRKATELLPDDAEAHHNFGITLTVQGHLTEAAVSYLRALAIKPNYVEAHRNLGSTFYEQGRLSEAETCYRQALEIKPDYVEALNSLALLFNTQGNPMVALSFIERSLHTKETQDAKGLFVKCVKFLRFGTNNIFLRNTMVRALSEPWDRPSYLALIAANLVKLNPNIKEFVTQTVKLWPQRLPAHDLSYQQVFPIFAADTLLCTLLESAPVCDIELERLLTMARHVMLKIAIGAVASDLWDDPALGFYSALARQCFINEYVFTYVNGETEQARALRDLLIAAMEAEAQISILLLLTVAAYFPLHSLPHVNRLLDRPWPDMVTAVLMQQVCEPKEERQYRASIPRLTPVEDDVSQLVQQQYEENPYPRWIKVAPAIRPLTIDEFLRQAFPLVAFKQFGQGRTLDILIAGCGTGQQSIQIAQQFSGAKIMAIDLSLTSLCYATRKTQQLGLTSIEYAQADLLKLENLNRSFNFIAVSGVLHHLDDPFAGWRVLLSLLRPGGFMFLGLYSEMARRNIVRARAFIAEHGYDSTDEDIRRCRQDLINSEENMGLETLFKMDDFFSISGCRDLLFHVQEHRMTLASIDAFLQGNNLQFLGFQLEASVLHAYRQRFPNDSATTNIDHWQTFEIENPDTFLGMYQFYVQKTV